MVAIIVGIALTIKTYGAERLYYPTDIEGSGDIITGGAPEYNDLYLHGVLPDEALKPARGLGLDFSDQ